MAKTEYTGIVRRKGVSRYCCRVRGDGAQPRLRDGDYLIVAPSHESNLGDEVLVELTNGQRLVCELVTASAGHAELRPTGEQTASEPLDAAVVKSIDYIAGIARSCVDGMARGPEVRT